MIIIYLLGKPFVEIGPDQANLNKRNAMNRIETQESERQTKSQAGIYCFMDVVAKQAEEYAADHTSPMSALLEEIEHFTLTKTPFPSMLTGRVEGRFLQMVVQLSGARNIVEIGTLTGYSALAMAEV
jgi:predicted O-methyltransferase YrrM